MRRRTDLSQKLNNVLYFLSGVLAVVVVGIIFINIKTKASETVNTDYLENQATKQENSQNQVKQEKWQEGVIDYKGEKYKFDSSLDVYLLMGIDNDNPVETAPDSVSGGQCDALFLLIADSQNKQLSIVSINRNAMTEIEVYDENGKKLGFIQGQICGQHGFGDGKKLSCSRTVTAVSKMFNNLPISGYISINMGAIGEINDAVGGVEVTVMQDVVSESKGVYLTAGETKTLNGDEAYCYLRNRDLSKFESATDRLRRDEQYLGAFIKKLQSQSESNSALAVSIYNSTSDYLVTNVEFTDLVSTLMGYQYSQDCMYTVPGETVKGDTYEEFNINSEEFNDLMIQLFYKKVD